MRKRFIKTAALGAALALGLSAAPAAQAAMFNFGDLADDTPGDNEGDWDVIGATGDTGNAPGSWTNALTGLGGAWAYSPDGNLFVVAEGSGDSNSRAYLDGPSGGPGGLGVCSRAQSLSCAGLSDDNAGLAGDTGGGAAEAIKLSFYDSDGDAVTVSFDSIVFRDRDHVIHGSDFRVDVSSDMGLDLQPWNTVDTADLGAGTMFTFTRAAPLTTPNLTRDFYIDIANVSIVPLPAAGFLLLGGLAGLGLMSRRRKAAA